jgi:hypothetical protein
MSATNYIASSISDFVVIVRYIFLPWLRSYVSGRRLEHQGGRAKSASSTEVVLVTPYYGNERLLPSFLDHHRRQGMDEFVFLDLSAEGTLSARLAGDADCAVWRPRGAPDAGLAIFWLNYLRWRYGTGRWCLSIEPNELFVFPHCETRQIKDLIEFVETERRGHVFALVIEMYGERPAASHDRSIEDHPLAALPYFDPYGYTTAAPGRFRNILVRGGLWRRALFTNSPRRTPAVNRVPLVKWRWYFVYLAGTRFILPRRLNLPHPPFHSSPTACLLRFALLDDDASLALAAKAEARQILGDGGGLCYPGVEELRRLSLKEEMSVHFTSSRDLLEYGLLNPGQWF